MNEQNDPEANDMVIPARERLYAYISTSELICLAQSNEMTCEEPDVVGLLPVDVPVVIEWLKRLLAKSTAR